MRYLMSLKTSKERVVVKYLSYKHLLTVTVFSNLFFALGLYIVFMWQLHVVRQTACPSSWPMELTCQSLMLQVCTVVHIQKW